jgi:hypothetical protein
LRNRCLEEDVCCKFRLGLLGISATGLECLDPNISPKEA